jgi:hypothetical protein
VWCGTRQRSPGVATRQLPLRQPAGRAGQPARPRRRRAALWRLWPTGGDPVCTAVVLPGAVGFI